jgi:hypothetical protein
MIMELGKAMPMKDDVKMEVEKAKAKEIAME